MARWKQHFDIAITAGVVAIAALSIWLIVSSQSTVRDEVRSYLVEDWEAYNQKGIRLGPTTPALEVTAFLDLTCPHSRALIPVLDSIRSKHPEDIAVVWMHFPLSGRPHSRDAAIGAECAREQNRFQVAVSSIVESDEGEFAGLPGSLMRLLPDQLAFEACIERSPSSFELIAEHRSIALTTGALGTPYVWVNGRFFTGRTVEDFSDALVALGGNGRDTPAADQRR